MQSYKCFLNFQLATLMLVAMTTIVQCQANGNISYIERADKHKFKIVWNMPTFMCQKYGINFTHLLTDSGIVQNSDGMFRGDVVSLLYDPGMFPALLGTKKYETRNKGVPQEGNLTLHLGIFRDTLNKLMPDTGFNGLGVIDFEHWRPIWRENWGYLNRYREYSISLEKYWPITFGKKDLEEKASKRFELAAKDFMQQTLSLAKQLYPNAFWGYYGYPFCFNYKLINGKLPCTQNVKEDNNKSKWLFKESTALFPSIYLRIKDMSWKTNRLYIQGRVDEAVRMAKVNNQKIYAYVWPKYSDVNQLLSSEDIKSSLQIPMSKRADGVVIWGSSKDLDNKHKCETTHEYLKNVLGPLARSIQR